MKQINALHRNADIWPIFARQTAYLCKCHFTWGGQETAPPLSHPRGTVNMLLTITHIQVEHFRTLQHAHNPGHGTNVMGGIAVRIGGVTFK